MPDPIVATGAASGIGRAVCEQLVAQGHDVIGLDLRPTDVTGVTSVVCDLTDADSIDAALEQIGPQIAGLVNCAGLPGTHRPERVLTVNLLAARRLAGALAQRIPRGGAVVNVASVAAMRSDRSDGDVAEILSASDAAALQWLAEAGLEGPAAYDFSKKALVALTLANSAEWLSRGVRCVSVSPGPTATPILGDFERSMGADRIRASAEAVGGHAEPQDVAGIVVFLLGASARWINGIDVRVDGGLLGSRLAPTIRTSQAR